jgi:uncharacterized sulfatase
MGIQDSPQATTDGIRTERALHFLKSERDPKKPFFLGVGFHTPHVPWDTTKECFDQHQKTKFTLEQTPADATRLPAGSLLQEPGLELSESLQQTAQKGYYAAVTFLDQQVGRLLDALRTMGLSENTWVVFTSDHGYHLGWRGQWCKHSLDEQVLRVPLIVRKPGSTSGQHTQAIVELLDLFPSFCEFAQIPVPNTLDGRSFLPLLENPAAPGKEAAFCQSGNGRTVRTARWRLVERFDGSRELYDHDADPGEFFSVADAAENAPILSTLHSFLEKELGPLPRKSPRGSGKN